MVVLKDSFGFLRLTHDYYDPEDICDDDDDDIDEDDVASSSKRLPTLRAQAQLFFHITEYFKNPELREEGEEEEDRPLLAGDMVKFKVVRGGQEKGTGGKHQNENKEGKTHKATDVMRCSKGDLRVKIIQEQVEGVVKRGLKGKTKHDAYGGCVSCSLLTSTGEQRRGEEEAYGARIRRRERLGEL